MQYINLITMEPISKIDLITRLQQEPEELERLIISTKARILKEISALDGGDENSMPNFSEQMKLILELEDYGFHFEACECMQILGLRIRELNPQLVPWYQLHFKAFGIKLFPAQPLPPRPIFIETFEEKNGVLEVTYCTKDWQDLENPDWTTKALLASDLLEFARECGLNTVVIDNVDHQGEHIQQEMKAPIFNYVQENMEVFIKKYIQAGWPTVSL